MKVKCGKCRHYIADKGNYRIGLCHGESIVFYDDKGECVSYEKERREKESERG